MGFWNFLELFKQIATGWPSWFELIGQAGIFFFESVALSVQFFVFDLEGGQFIAKRLEITSQAIDSLRIKVAWLLKFIAFWANFLAKIGVEWAWTIYFARTLVLFEHLENVTMLFLKLVNQISYFIVFRVLMSDIFKEEVVCSGRLLFLCRRILLAKVFLALRSNASSISSFCGWATHSVLLSKIIQLIQVIL